MQKLSLASSPLKPHLHAQLPAGAGLAVDPVRQDLRCAGGRPVGAVGLYADLGPAAAGLGGIAFEAGGVICLSLDEMIAEADRHNLFLWAREP